MKHKKGVRFYSAISAQLAREMKVVFSPETRIKTMCSSQGISLNVSSCPDFLKILLCLHFLPLHITEDPLKYSLAMYHCALFSQHILHTLSIFLSPFFLSFLCLLPPMCYTTMTMVFAIGTQSRAVYSSFNRISCRVETLSRCQEASAATKDVFARSSAGRCSLPLL